MEDNSKKSINTTAVESLLNEWDGQTTVGDGAGRIVSEARKIVESLDDDFEVSREVNPGSADESVFADGREDVLYDAWMVLRAEGLSLDALSEFSAFITATTVYETADMEGNHRIFTLGEDEAVVNEMSDEELLSR